MRNPSALFFLLLCTALSPAGCSRGPGPLSPEEALRSFQIHEGFRVELFAAEPNVIDPVELVFDEQGRAFVAEMLDYPFDPPAGEKPKSRIRLLVDSNDDGRIDSASVFADGLRQVTSLLPWKGGLIATAAPDILYLQDTDGDGQADRREVLFTGFSMGDDPQSRVTNLRFGVDNWIYASNSRQQGTITSPIFPDAPAVRVLGADFRFRLDRKRFEPASGGAQFGLAMDDWGHRFLTQNTVHVRHVVIPRRYLERNPFLTSGRAVEDISDHGRPSAPIFQLTPPQYWREVRTRMRQRRFDELSVDRKEIASGYFTGASGGTIYSGDTFGEEFRGNLFTGDVSGNLVHRDLLRADGVTFTAQRAAEERDREFLASTDPWFRPCNFTTGPDGNLYMVDIYREFVETPASIPEELLEDMDMYSGNRRGRIYRIVPSSEPAAKPVKPNLGRAGIAELVRLLSHPNGWWRLTAQRLLLERQDASAVPALQKVLKQSDSPQARLHALYALEGLNVLQASMVRAALDDAHPGVREHAVRLSDRFPVLAAQLASRVTEPSARVAFQLALSLGNYKDSGSFQALVALAARNSHDPWFRTAILSSEAGSSVRMLEALLARPAFFQNTETGKEKFLEELSAVIGARNDREEVGRLLRILAASPSLRSEDWQVAGLSGLARGLKPAGATRLRIPGAETFL